VAATQCEMEHEKTMADEERQEGMKKMLSLSLSLSLFRKRKRVSKGRYCKWRCSDEWRTSQGRMTGQGRQVWRAINGFSYWRPRSCPLLRSAPFYTLSTPPYTYICIYIRIYQTVFRRFPLSARQLTAPNETAAPANSAERAINFAPHRNSCPSDPVAPSATRSTR